jgi:hypothetical protein
VSHIVSRQQWADIDLDTQQGLVFVEEDWQFTWRNLPNTQAWTLAEKRHFVHRLQQQVWARWSDHIRLRVAGTTDFCRKFQSQGVRVNFGALWVLAGGKWSVNVYKVPAGSAPGAYRENVTFGTNSINLYTSAMRSYTAGNAAGASGPGFLANPHEFGHTMNNPDEYIAGSPNLGDTASTMNIGNQIRARHLGLLMQVLNRLLPGVTFSTWVT